MKISSNLLLEVYFVGKNVSVLMPFSLITKPSRSAFLGVIRR